MDIWYSFLNQTRIWLNSIETSLLPCVVLELRPLERVFFSFNIGLSGRKSGTHLSLRDMPRINCWCQVFGNGIHSRTTPTHKRVHRWRAGILGIESDDGRSSYCSRRSCEEVNQIREQHRRGCRWTRICCGTSYFLPLIFDAFPNGRNAAAPSVLSSPDTPMSL